MNTGPPPPPPPPPPVPGVLPSVKLPCEISGSASRAAPVPAALAGAMMKDKKPFTYTPGGLDLSEIRSPKIQRRLVRNAASEGVKLSPLAQPSSSQETASHRPTGKAVQGLPGPGGPIQSPVSLQQQEVPKVRRNVCGPPPPPPPFLVSSGTSPALQPVMATEPGPSAVEVPTSSKGILPPRMQDSTLYALHQLERTSSKTVEDDTDNKETNESSSFEEQESSYKETNSTTSPSEMNDRTDLPYKLEGERPEEGPFPLFLARKVEETECDLRKGRWKRKDGEVDGSGDKVHPAKNPDNDQRENYVLIRDGTSQSVEQSSLDMTTSSPLTQSTSIPASGLEQLISSQPLTSGSTETNEVSANIKTTDSSNLDSPIKQSSSGFSSKKEISSPLPVTGMQNKQTLSYDPKRADVNVLSTNKDLNDILEQNLLNHSERNCLSSSTRQNVSSPFYSDAKPKCGPSVSQSMVIFPKTCNNESTLLDPTVTSPENVLLPVLSSSGATPAFTQANISKKEMLVSSDKQTSASDTLQNDGLLNFSCSEPIKLDKLQNSKKNDNISNVSINHTKDYPQLTKIKVEGCKNKGKPMETKPAALLVSPIQADPPKVTSNLALEHKRSQADEEERRDKSKEFPKRKNRMPSPPPTKSATSSSRRFIRQASLPAEPVSALARNVPSLRDQAVYKSGHVQSTSDLRSPTISRNSGFCPVTGLHKAPLPWMSAQRTPEPTPEFLAHSQRIQNRFAQIYNNYKPAMQCTTPAHLARATVAPPVPVYRHPGAHADKSRTETLLKTQRQDLPQPVRQQGVQRQSDMHPDVQQMQEANNRSRPRERIIPIMIEGESAPQTPSLATQESTAVPASNRHVPPISSSSTSTKLTSSVPSATIHQTVPSNTSYIRPSDFPSTSLGGPLFGTFNSPANIFSTNHALEVLQQMQQNLAQLNYGIQNAFPKLIQQRVSDSLAPRSPTSTPVMARRDDDEASGPNPAAAWSQNFQPDAGNPTQSKSFKLIQNVLENSDVGDLQEPLHTKGTPATDGTGGCKESPPQPRKYTGSSIPSRSFKVLQAVTGTGDAAGLGESDL